MSLLQYQNLQTSRFFAAALIGTTWVGGLADQAYSGQEYFAEKKREEEKWKARE